MLYTNSDSANLIKLIFQRVFYYSKAARLYAPGDIRTRVSKIYGDPGHGTRDTPAAPDTGQRRTVRKINCMEPNYSVTVVPLIFNPIALAELNLNWLFEFWGAVLILGIGA